MHINSYYSWKIWFSLHFAYKSNSTLRLLITESATFVLLHSHRSFSGKHNMNIKNDTKKRKIDREKKQKTIHAKRQRKEKKKKPGLTRYHNSVDGKRTWKNRTCVLCLNPWKIKLKLGKKNKRAYELFVIFILG
jgi:hypothetical protein